MQVLEDHGLSCENLLHVKLEGIILTKQSKSANRIHIMMHIPFSWIMVASAAYVRIDHIKVWIKQCPASSLLVRMIIVLVFGRHTSMHFHLLILPQF